MAVFLILDNYHKRHILESTKESFGGSEREGGNMLCSDGNEQQVVTHAVTRFVEDLGREHPLSAVQARNALDSCDADIDGMIRDYVPADFERRAGELLEA